MPWVPPLQKIVIDDKDFGAVITKDMNFDATKKDNNRCDGARMQKYEVDKVGSVKWAENDFVLMRYSDVLWMKEEAIMRGGSGTSGTSSLKLQKSHQSWAKKIPGRQKGHKSQGNALEETKPEARTARRPPPPAPLPRLAPPRRAHQQP